MSQQTQQPEDEGTSSRKEVENRTIKTFIESHLVY